MKPHRDGTALRMLGCGLALTLSASAQAGGWFHPPEQSLPASCLQAALAKYPGKIERVHVTPPGIPSRARIYIEQADGREWIVFCNLKTGTIEKSVLVDDL